MSRWWLRLLARLVPPGRRREWLREWDAEAAYRGDKRLRRRRANWLAPLEDAVGLRRAFIARRTGKTTPAHRLAGLLIDLRHALRGLRRNPGPVLLSALSMTLAIGATATMISVIDAVDFRPLPYRDADSLVQLALVASRDGDGTMMPASPDLFRLWQERTRSFEALGAASPIAASLGENDQTLGASRATADFFPALGVTPRLGRVFSAREVRDGAPVIVISHQLWRTRFGGDTGVLGRTVSLSWAGEYRSVAAAPFTVVGVLPRGVQYPRGSDVWLPATGGFNGPADNPMLTTIGRLRPGISPAAAADEIASIGEQLARERPDAYDNTTGAVQTMRQAIRTRADGRGTSARFILLLVAAFVLVLATINMAVVFLVRATRDDHDMRVRAALGASRARLLAPALGQSLSVSLAAGAGGVLLSAWGIRLADARLAVSATGFAPVLDGRVASAALLLSMSGGLCAGLFAATHLRPSGAHGRLGARTSSLASSAAGSRAQAVLVVAQVACAVVLLHGAGVLAHDFVSVINRDTGFEADRLIVARLQLLATHDDAIATAGRIAEMSGIASTAVGGLPAEGYSYRLQGGERVTGARRPFSYRVSAGYFRTLGIPLLSGRAFTAADRGGSAPVAVVSRTAAAALWPGASPVGKRLLMENAEGVGEWVTIVGVSDDERIDRDVRSPVVPILYRPWGQLANERRRIEIFARAAADPAPLVAQVHSIVREARAGDGWQGDQVLTMSTILGSHLELQRFRASALLLFSLFALILASVGVYGAVATVVSQRTAEIGVRMALGARPADALALVARGGMGMALAGLLLGLTGAVATHGLLDSLIVDNAGFEIPVLAAAAAFLLAVAGAATYLPGRRATRIDPALSLRA
jgi:predicted permease